MVRTNQGGSILGFVIVGGVLAVLLVGGAYLVRNNFAPVEQATEIVTQDDEENSEETEQQPEDENSESSQDSDEQQTSENSEPERFSPGRTNQDSEPEPTNTTEDEHDSLPETGPADAVFAGIMLSTFAAVSTHYVRSRRLV